MACLSAQVDMFSYGMVLYELLSGQRPALGHHQLQIAKKLSKGIRPVLGQPEEVQFHRLQALMMECWDTKPEKVRGRVEPGPFLPWRQGLWVCACSPTLPKDRWEIFSVSSRQNFSSTNVPPSLGVCAQACACMSICGKVTFFSLTCVLGTRSI